MARVICHAPRSNIPSLTPSEEEYLESVYRRWEKLGGWVKVGIASELELGWKNAVLISAGTFLIALLVGGLLFHLNPLGL